jgi:DNA-binding response OmpR family regulator
VLVLVPDLLFGSQVQGMLAAAGDEVELAGDENRARDRLGDAAAPAVAVLVVDLTTDALDGPALVARVRSCARAPSVSTRTSMFRHASAPRRPDSI